jgi:predicted dinucleotide-binding enzyme
VNAFTGVVARRTREFTAVDAPRAIEADVVILALPFANSVGWVIATVPALHGAAIVGNDTFDHPAGIVIVTVRPLAMPF